MKGSSVSRVRILLWLVLMTGVTAVSLMLLCISLNRRDVDHGNRSGVCTNESLVAINPQVNPQVNLSAKPAEVVQQDLCPVAKGDIFLLIYIFSHPGNSDARNRIRNTYAAPALKRRHMITVVFIVGQVPEEFEGLVDDEREIYNDILSFPVEEDYRNLPKKTNHTLQWLTTHCPQASYIMKTDDDVFINIFAVLWYIRAYVKPDDNRLHCGVLDNFVPVRIEGDPWYVSREEFEGDVLPPYCVGHGVIYSRTVVFSLVEGYRRVNTKLWIEDAVTYGFVRIEMGLEMVNIKDYFQDGFSANILNPRRKWFEHLTVKEWAIYWKALWEFLMLLYPEESYALE